MTYQETINRILLLRGSLKEDTGRLRLEHSRELMKLKRNLCKFKEHKKNNEDRDG